MQFSHEGGSYYASRVTHANQIAQAVGLDMTKWWKPGHAFLQRVPKAIAIQAVTEAGLNPAIGKTMEKAKKYDAIITAEQSLEGRGWLPMPLRLPKAAAIGAADHLEDAAALADDAEPLASADGPDDDAYGIAAE